MGFGPVDGLPACRFVGSCTSNVGAGLSVPQRCCYHLLCLLDRLANLSRAERPDGSQLTFVREDVALPIRLITRRPSLFPSSSTRRSVGSSCDELSRLGELRAYHVPRLYHDGEGSACPPVTRCLRQESQKPLCRSRTFWFKPVSIFGLSSITAFINSSLSLTISSYSSGLIRRDAGRSSALSQRLYTASVAVSAYFGRIGLGEQSVMSKLVFSITANQATFVSHQIIGREGETATLIGTSLVEL